MLHYSLLPLSTDLKILEAMQTYIEPGICFRLFLLVLKEVYHPPCVFYDKTFVCTNII